jgi:hypothetical protein
LLSPLKTPIACHSAMASSDSIIAAAGATPGGARAGYGYRGTGNGGPSRKKEEGKPWCAIHETITHNTSECNIRTNTYCKYCRTDLQPKTLEDHIDSCTGMRCHECNRRGHKAAWCRDRMRKEGTSGNQNDRSGNGSTTRIEETKRVRHVNAERPVHGRSAHPHKRVAVTTTEQEDTEPSESETQTDSAEVRTEETN